jgi:hypothetical protein
MTLAVAVPLVLIVFPLVYSLVDAAIPGRAAAEPFLEFPEGEERCVRDTEYMRYHHMNLLLEIRDEVQRDGIRKRAVGMSHCYPEEGETDCYICRDCHDNRAAFCNRCHNAVNLSPDCFGCHYYPETPDGPGTPDTFALEGAR